MIRRPPTSTPFPYTTPFRSRRPHARGRSSSNNSLIGPREPIVAVQTDGRGRDSHRSDRFLNSDTAPLSRTLHVLEPRFPGGVSVKSVHAYLARFESCALSGDGRWPRIIQCQVRCRCRPSSHLCPWLPLVAKAKSRGRSELTAFHLNCHRKVTGPVVHGDSWIAPQRTASAEELNPWTGIAP